MSSLPRKPLVSVLMTAYNREKYIAEAIESVLASTYQNFELIIVDDVSTDRTIAIATEYATRDPRVRLYHNEKNLGDYPNRNRAASYAKGEYMKYLDADDVYYPWCLEVEVNLMEQHPEAHYGLDSLDQDPNKPFPIMLNPREAYYRNFFERSIFQKAPSSLIIRTDIFRAVGGFSGIRMVGDFELWLTLSKKFNVLLLPLGMVWCRVHAEQESSLIRSSSLVVFWYSVTAIRQLAAGDCPLTEQECQELIARVKRSQARSVLRSLLVERNVKASLEKVRLCGMSWPLIFYYSFKKIA